MNGDVVEALLEMHYHPAIVRMFEQTRFSNFELTRTGRSV